MNISIDHKTILCDHRLKAFLHALQSCADYDRSVRVICDEGFVTFEILTIDDEAKMEVGVDET
jgi:hypothetical protein